jgi:hypothetical protein
VGTGAGLDNMKKEKFLTLLELEFDPTVFQPVVSCYTDCTTEILEGTWYTYKYGTWKNKMGRGKKTVT